MKKKELIFFITENYVNFVLDTNLDMFTDPDSVTEPSK